MKPKLMAGKYPLFLLNCLLFTLSTLAQETTISDVPPQRQRKLDHWTITVANHHSAFPFSAFSKLFTGELHPGFEVGTGFNWRSRRRHDWYQEFKLGYFYHQFIQHGIPLYTNFGYRHRFGERWMAQAGIGAGYFHSIPDHQRFRLNGEGEYEKLRSLGRAQVMVVANLTAGYRFAAQSRHPLTAFMTYQQRIQLPYVRSYVPMLPYNTVLLGVRREGLQIGKKNANR